MITAYCDGGCDNVTHTKAYGSFYIDTNPPTIKRYDFDHIRTSNESEYEIFTILLEYLLNCGYKSEEKIRIYSDSKLLVNQIKGLWRVKAENIKTKHDYALSFLQELNNVELVWTPRKTMVRILGH